MTTWGKKLTVCHNDTLRDTFKVTHKISLQVNYC